MKTLLENLPDWFVRLIDIVQSRTRYAVLATALFCSIIFTFALATQGELLARVFDHYAGAEERANETALEAIAAEDRASDVMISAMLRQLIQDLNAGRVIIKIVTFDKMTGEFSDLVESHEIMDRRAERTGLRTRTLTRGDVERTLDTMFPSNGRVVCMTVPVDDVLDPPLKRFLRVAEFSWTSACPIVDPLGNPMGLLAVSGREPLTDVPMVTERVRDSAFLLSGYLLRSPQAAAARERLEDR